MNSGQAIFRWVLPEIIAVALGLVVLGMAQPASCEWQSFTTAQGLAGNPVGCMVEDRAGTLWFLTETHAATWISRYDGLTWRSFSNPIGCFGLHTIVADSRGSLWFGTKDWGALRFDGTTWNRFTAFDSLASDDVRSILEDRKGHLWFGTGGGLSFFNGTTWHTFTTADSLASNDVRSIVEDHDGHLWFGTGGGVSRFNGTTWHTFTTADSLVSNDVRSIVEDGKGNLWFATADGVSRFNGTTWRTFTTADSLASNDVQSILIDPEGRLWFVTGGGVSRYDGATWQTLAIPQWTTSFHLDHAGNFWFGTVHGLVRFDGANWRTFTTSDGLADNDVTSILEDRSGNLWFGTTGGVSRFDGATWHGFTTDDGLPRSFAASILEDARGNIWSTTSGNPRLGTVTGSGASRFHGDGWHTFTSDSGLASNNVQHMIADHAGNVWCATDSAGVSRFDGASWHTFTSDSGLASNDVRFMLEDHTRTLWFLTSKGINSYDGVGWRTFVIDDTLASAKYGFIAEDQLGNLWFSTRSGASRYDRTTWRNFPYYTAWGLDGVKLILAGRGGNMWFASERGSVSRYGQDTDTWETFPVAEWVNAMLEDTAGDVWFATDLGAIQYHGAEWRTHPIANWVSSIMEDRAGNLWFATDGGVSRYDGRWQGFSTHEGLRDVYQMLEDQRGNLWFATSRGVSRYEPDRVPPRTVLLNAPPRLSSSRNQSAVFAAGFGESRGVEFSYSLDGSDSSSWSPVSSWFASGLRDTTYVLKVRSRDFLSNVDTTGAVATFEIDATPPSPVIVSPTSGQAVRDSLIVRGTADDRRFRNYRVDLRRQGSASWDSLLEDTTRVPNGVLARFRLNPASVPDDIYELRLAVTDTLGLTGTALVSFIVDNEAPYADETTPAKVAAATGGDIFTTNGETHLYFPPHAFPEDAVVTITPSAASAVPDTLATGATRVLSGYEIAWGGAPLQKPVRLEFSYAGVNPTPAGSALAMYVSTDGATWRRLGGTVDASSHRITLAVTEPGRYALYAGGTVPDGEGTLSSLSFTPRVFSPAGTFADREVGIAFTLGRSGPVTVRVYNRAGRLVREVVSGEQMGAGANLVRWDGRDREGAMVTDGVYLVTVGALGQNQTKTLAVVK